MTLCFDINTKLIRQVHFMTYLCVPCGLQVLGLSQWMPNGGRVMLSSLYGDVDKSPDIDWLQEHLDTYIQTDLLKAWMRRWTLRADEEAEGVLNVVTKTYVLQEKVCVSLTALLLLGLLYMVICSAGRLIALQGFVVDCVCLCVCVLSIYPVRHRSVCIDTMKKLQPRQQYSGR